MHLHRTILLGLGPLLSLWAMGAFPSEPAARVQTHAASEQWQSATFVHLIQPLASLLFFESDEASAPVGVHRADVLGFEALRLTPLAGSVRMIRETPPANHHTQRNLRFLLRC